MNGKGSGSLKELRSLREAVLAEEKAKAKAIIETLPPNELAEALEEPPASPIGIEGNGTESSAAPESAAEPTIVPLPEMESDLSLPEEAIPSTPPEAVHRPPAPAPEPAPEPVPPIQLRPAPQAPPPRPKVGTKDPALIIPLTPKIKERLQRHVEQSRWSPADLVIELIRSTLHRGYPAIQCGNQILARAGSYRTIERNPFESVLKIVSGQGVFNVGVRPENPEFQRLLAHFQNHNSSDAEHCAIQGCLFELQRYLEAVEDFTTDSWVKTVSADSFSVEPLT